MKKISHFIALTNRPTACVTRGWVGRENAIFGGTNFQSRKLPENAATPIRRVHAVLGGFNLRVLPGLCLGFLRAC